jgi:hypothetical protein
MMMMMMMMIMMMMMMMIIIIIEKGIKELGPRNVYEYLEIEESHDTKHKNEK